MVKNSMECFGKTYVQYEEKVKIEGDNMNKSEIIEKMCQYNMKAYPWMKYHNGKSWAKQEVDQFFRFMKEALLDGEEVTISGFGTFHIEIQPERDIKHPKTGEPIHVPEKKILKFKQSKSFAEKLNECNDSK